MQQPHLDASFAKHYDLGNTISDGPRALVVEAVQVSSRQRVAIKFFAPETDLAAARAVQERLARLTAQRHPNVVTVLEAGLAGTTPYLVMEYLEGGALTARLADGPLPLAHAAGIALDCVKAITAVRRKGFAVARLSTDDVLLAEGGQAKLAGLARAGAPLDDPATVRAIAQLLAAMLGEESVLALPAASARGLEQLAEVLRPHAGRSAALVDAPPPQAAPVASLTAAEPLPLTPVILGKGGAGYGATQVLHVRGAAGTAPPPPDRLPARSPWAFALAMLLAVVTVAAAGFVMRKPVPLLLEQARDVWSTRASVSWKTNPGCYSQIEYWQAVFAQNKLRTKRLPVQQAEHRHSMPDLKPDTTYNFRFLFSYSLDEEGETFASEVFDFTTRPEIQIFNIHVDEYATKGVLTWETNLRTDTTVKYGRTDQYEDLRTNPEQKSETLHSITLEGLSPDTTYHYQLLASDPRRRGEPKASEDLLFRTSREDSLGDAQGKENAGLVNLTKSYVDKLSRMTPDEREKLRTSIQKFTDPKTEVSAADKRQLLETRTASAKDDEFNNRLQMARCWYAELSIKGRKVGDHQKVCRLLETLFYTNRVQGGQRLDALFKRLDRAERENQSLEDLANTLESGADIEVQPGKPTPVEAGDPIE